MFKNDEKETILNSIPLNGFIKIPKSGTVNITSKEKVLLVRKGNELINKKNYDQAKRVFLAIGYSAGLIRLGEHYQTDGNIFEALKMYKAANAHGKLDKLTEKMAGALRVWIMDK